MVPNFRCSSLNFEFYFTFNYQRQEQQTTWGCILPSIHQRWRWWWEGLVVRRQSHPRRKLRSGLRHLHRRPRYFSWQLDGSCRSTFWGRASLSTEGSSSLSLKYIYFFCCSGLKGDKFLFGLVSMVDFASIRRFLYWELLLMGVCSKGKFFEDFVAVVWIQNSPGKKRNKI